MFHFVQSGNTWHQHYVHRVNLENQRTSEDMSLASRPSKSNHRELNPDQSKIQLKSSRIRVRACLGWDESCWITHRTLHSVTMSESFSAWRRSLPCLQLIIIQLFGLYIDAYNEFSFLSSKDSIPFCKIFGSKSVGWKLGLWSTLRKLTLRYFF